MFFTSSSVIPEFVAVNSLPEYVNSSVTSLLKLVIGCPLESVAEISFAFHPTGSPPGVFGIIEVSFATIVPGSVDVPRALLGMVSFIPASLSESTQPCDGVIGIDFGAEICKEARLSVTPVILELA